MSTDIMTSIKYDTAGQVVQGSFGIAYSENVSVSAVSNQSLVIPSEIVIISSVDYYYFNEGAAATTANTILPPGFTVLKLKNRDSILHFLRAGTADFSLSVIIPR